jgi:hypothetical protein
MVAAVCVAAAQGGLVNPVITGASNYLDAPAVEAVATTSESDDVWATVNCATTFENLPASVGAPTINSVNTYPNLALWAQLDPTGACEEVYNRYAHIQIELIPQNNTPLKRFELIQADLFTVTLTPAELAQLGATKLFSTNPNLEELSSDAATITKLWQGDTAAIYSLTTPSTSKDAS